MTNKDFQLLTAMQQNGFTEGTFYFCADIEDTHEYFGTDAHTSLVGPWLAVWRKKDERPYLVLDQCGRKEIHPIHIMELKDCDDEVLLLFRFDNKEFD